MIYDGFLFHNEFDILDIRFNVLNDVVDYFIVVEGTITHSGKPKEPCFLQQKDRYNKFWDKIIHVLVDDTPETDDNYERQKWQRDAMMRPLVDNPDGDILIISDVDEIPSINAIQEATKFPFCKIKMLAFYYFLNVLVNDCWYHPCITSLGFLREHSTGPTSLRHSGCDNIVDGGWHFSYLGGIEKIKDKLTSFGGAKQFGNSETLNNLESSIRLLHSPWDLKNENGNYENILDIGDDKIYPQYIIDNKESLIQKGFVHPRKNNRDDLIPLMYTNYWFNYGDFYKWIVKEFPDYKRFVEVGCWKGHSISYLADLLKKKEVEIYGIDLFDDVPFITGREIEIKFIRDIYDMVLEEKGIKDKIKTIKADSSKGTELFDHESLDFVFIDANHDYNYVKKDIQAWLPKIKNSGIIAGHDWPYVERAVNETIKNVNIYGGNVWFAYLKEQI